MVILSLIVTGGLVLLITFIRFDSSTEDTKDEETALLKAPASPGELHAPDTQLLNPVAWTATISPSPPSQTSTPTAEASIVILEIPDTIRSGEQFTIGWTIAGPPSTAGSQTTLTASYQTAQTSAAGSVSASSRTSQSFGSFTIPASFEATISLDGPPGPIMVSITAEIDAQTIEATRIIELR